MSLLDQLREAQDEPARHRSSPWAGPSILSVAQLRAMERALAREMASFDGEPVLDVVPEPAPAAVVIALPQSSAIEPLPAWSPPVRSAGPREALPVVEDVVDDVAVPAVPEVPAIEPLPLWTPPVFDVPTRSSAMTLDPCPNCGEEAAIDRIDLTVNASWLNCRACGLRWGGSVDRPPSDATPLLPALPEPSASTARGQIAAG